METQGTAVIIEQVHTRLRTPDQKKSNTTNKAVTGPNLPSTVKTEATDTGGGNCKLNLLTLFNI